ncbi:site-specific integrase, partial [Anaerococcus sp.]
MTRPIVLVDYLNYLKSIRGLSLMTIKEYSYDLEVFFEYQII